MSSIGRAVPPPDFSTLSDRRLQISALHDHALISDISRFYGTLYTHAIPWALHGKSVSKAALRRRTLRFLLGDKIDVALRRGQENQTLGIPVGPDTSRIVSEIVAVSIDTDLKQSLGASSSRAFRYVDDWYIGFDSAGEAEAAVSTLAAACRVYELELNAEKTRSLHASAEVEGYWAIELREHNFGISLSRQKKAIDSYFIRAFHHANNFPDQNVLTYAVKRTKSIDIFKENWSKYEDYLLKSARTSASAIPSVVQLLINYNFRNYEIDKIKVGKLIEDLIAVNAVLSNHAEVAWALFAAKGLRISLKQTAADAVTKLDSSVCALLALDLRSRSLIAGTLDLSNWSNFMTPDDLKSSMWLLAYEASIRGWLVSSPPDAVDRDPYFSILKKLRVSFYDENRNVEKTPPTKKKQQPRTASKSSILGALNISIELFDF